MATMGASADKAKRLAVLASREDTPEHERTAAALQLAKIIARDGVPPLDGEGGWSGVSGGAELAYLQRKVAALEAIVELNAAELRELRVEKADLEARLVVLRSSGGFRAGPG